MFASSTVLTLGACATTGDNWFVVLFVATIEDSGFSGCTYLETVVRTSSLCSYIFLYVLVWSSSEK